MPVVLDLQFVTVTGVNELANCAALVGSIARLCPGAPVTVYVCADDVHGVEIDGAEIRSASELGVNRLSTLAAGCPNRRLNRMLAGPAIESRLGEGDAVFFVEPQLTLVADPRAVTDGLSEGELMVFPSESEDGGYHPGAIAVRPGPGSSAIVESWPKPSLGSAIDPCKWFEGSVLTSQATSRSNRTVAAITVEPEPSEKPSQAPDGNPDQSVLFDWGALTPEAPNRSLIGNVVATNGLDLTALLRDYQEDLKSLRSARASLAPVSFPDGTPISPTLGRLALQAIHEQIVEKPFFEEDDWHRFVGWLNQPATFPNDVGLTRCHEELWKDSNELRGAYPQIQGADAEGYAGWLCVHAPERIGLGERLLPPRPSALDGYGSEDAREAALLSTLEGADPSDPLWGVNVAGFLTSELGLGEATRLLIAGLDATGIPCMPIQGALLPPSRQDAHFVFAGPDSAPYPVNIVCINGDGIPAFALEAGPEFFAGRHTIALWWWETDEIPETWDEAFRWIDEVWVASDLVADAVRKRAPVPVTKIKLPVVLPTRSLPGRAELGLPAGFNFYFSFDYHSTTARKNPIGVIEAFKQAFDEESGANLIIKSINAEKRPWDHAEVLNAAGGRADIQFIDRYVTPDERDGLVAACDCYVSLHRSEGLGLTPAEALWFGKPVISTGYGGVLEFLNEENSYLVMSKNTYVGPNADPYPPEGRWREPDVEHAAQLMRRVFDDQGEAGRKARQGAVDIRAGHSLVAAGESMRTRLEEIFAGLPDQERPLVSRLPPIGDHGVSERLESQPDPRGGFTARAVRRVLRKVEAQDRERQLGTDRQLLDLILTVDERLRTTAHELERGQLAEKAESLGLFRTIEAQTQEISSRLDEVLHLLAEHRSLPYLSKEHGFDEWVDAGAGRVQGFKDNEGQDGAIVGIADAFRGSEEHVRSLQKIYVELLRGFGPVLDVGSGRGEFLDLLGEAGIEAEGVDSDEEMVDRARSKGHKVECGDALERLGDYENSSLGAIFSAQVVEHLPFEQLERFISLSRSRLRPGGVFVAETVNPHCVNAMKTFWVDPTHRHPLFPETMLQLARSAGFDSAYVFHPNATGDVNSDRYSSPVYALVARAGS